MRECINTRVYIVYIHKTYFMYEFRSNYKLDRRNVRNTSNGQKMVPKHNKNVVIPLFSLNRRLQQNQRTLMTPIQMNPDRPNKKACLVGINYTGTPNQLYGCENDVKKIHHVLTSKYGYESHNITILTEKTRLKPTRRNILLQFVRLLVESKAGDQLFFGFSGHGYSIEDKDGDEDDGKDEIIITCENHYIVDDEFRRLTQQYMKPGVQLFGFFDNCHSGTILDLRYEYDIPLKTKGFQTVDDINTDEHKVAHTPVQIQTNKQYLETPGQVILLSGCRDQQKSIDAMINGQFNGVLTCTFMEILLNFPSTLTWYDAVQEMEFYIRKMRFDQRPLLSTGRQIDLHTPVQI